MGRKTSVLHDMGCRTHSHLCLHHGWSLSTQHFDSLEDVDHSLVTHPLQYYTQSDKYTCPANASTAHAHPKTCENSF